MSSKAKKMTRKRKNEEEQQSSPRKKRNMPHEDEVSNDVEMIDANDRNSIASRSGKINKIILKNFMCHSNLVIDFNKNINLVIGNNGSGKSAVLTALIVGLGSKSSATNRCTNIAQLIKRGETSGSVTIHIGNSGDNGYDQQTYGHQIIVERKFSSNGSSSYRIKNSSGQNISSSRKDLMKILLFMNIQVDNPVCVLTQDASRSFLKDSDPKSLYELFLKATQIDVVIQKLNDCISHHESTCKQLNYQKNLLVSLKDEVDKIRTKFDSLQAARYLKTTLREYKLELAWLKVQNEENKLEEINRKLIEYQQTLDELIELMNNRVIVENDRKARCELLTEQVNTLKDEMKEDVEQKERMRINISKVEEERNLIGRQLQKIIKTIENIWKNIEQLEKDIAESGESKRGRIAAEKEANEKKLEKLVQSKSEGESIKDNNKRDIEMMKFTKYKLEENITKLSAERLSLVQNTDKINAEIRQCDASKNSLLLFGPFMPELIKAIEQSNRNGEFHQLPRGPLGKYIEVTDEKFKGPVEGLIGRKLLSFCVNDAKDREVLNRLFAKISSKHPDVKKCSIITSKFYDQVHNVTRGKVQSVPNAYCVLDVIKCNEPVVTNILIDHCKVERILLAEDDKTGFTLTANVETVPQNLLKLIVLNPPTEMFPAPALRTYAWRKPPPRYLQANMKDRKEYLMNKVRDLKDRLQIVTEKINVDDAKRKSFAETINEKLLFEDKLEDSLMDVTQKIRKLQNIEYPEDDERQMLQEELEVLKRSHNDLEKERVSVKQQDDEMEAALKVNLNLMRGFEANIQDKTEKIEQKQIAINAENDCMAEQTGIFNADQRKAAKMKEDLKKIQVQERSCNKEIQALTMTAKNLAERVPIRNCQDYLTSKIKETEQIIKTVVNSKDSLQEVEQTLLLKSEEYEKKNELIENLEHTVKKLKRSRDHRYNWIKRFKSYMSICVHRKFNEILESGNYNGALTIDHPKELLELTVVPRDKNIITSVSSTQCLSGGERSFCTVAFLLALWSVIDSPFFFLDEYDVYTDAVNRDNITKLLLSQAAKKPYCQYSFLTPQDISNVKASNILSIQRLADPVRK